MSALKSLRVKAVLWALLPTLTVLAVVAVTSIYVYDQIARGVVQQRDAELAKVSALRLSERLAQQAEVLQDLAASQAVQSMVPTWLDLGLQQARGQLQVFDAGVTIYNSQARPVARLREGAAQTQAIDLEPSFFAQLQQTPGPAFSNVIPDPASGADVVLVAAPIFGPGGEFKGVITGASTLQGRAMGPAFAEALDLSPGHSGFAYLVDGNGRVMHHRDSSQLGRDLSSRPPVSRVLAGEIGAELSQDFSGEKVISGYAPVPGAGWGLVTQEKWADVVGPIQDWGKLLLGLLVLGGIIAAALIFWAMDRILTPVKDLTQGAERIAGGDFSHTIVAKTGDEIQTLAQRFNSMAQVVKEAYAHLEKRVDDRTAQLRKSQEAERQLAEENALLTRIGQIMSSTLDINEVYERFSQEVKGLVAFDRMNISVVDQAEGTYTVKYLSGIVQQGRSPGDIVPLHGSQTQQVVETGRPFITRDLEEESRFTADSALRAAGLRSRIMLPLTSRGHVIGTMTLHSRDVGAFGPREHAILERLARQIAPAVENARLYQEALMEKERATAALADLKTFDDALRESEERYRALFEQSKDAIFITRDGRVADANQASLDLFGYTREQAIGLDAVQVYDNADDRGMFREELQKHGSVKDFELRLVKKNGARIDCLLTATLHQLPDGHTVETQGIIRDITARKQAEEALRQSEERLRRAQQAGRLGTWDWDVRTNELIWDGVEPIHGLNTGTFDKSFESYLQDVHPNDRGLVLRSISQAVKQGADLDMEYRIIWPDGSLHWVHGAGRASVDESGRTIRVTGTCQDITQRKKAEEELRQSEERYRRLVEQAVDSFSLIDRKGAIVDVNQQACQALGYSRDELLGLSITDISPESNIPVPAEVWEEWIRHPEPVTLERVLRRKDGTAFPVEIRCGLIELSGRHLMFGLARDITERRESEETQIQQARELAVLGERNRMAREIHDTLAQGFTGVILQLEAAEQAQEDSPTELLEHLNRAKGLARQSLQEARRSVWNLLPHALEQLPLEDALREEIGKFGSETPVQSSFKVSGKRKDLPPDAQTALLRICQESLTNVRKHAQASQVKVHLTYYPDAVCLDIEDNGEGFDSNNGFTVTQQGGFGLSSMEQRARQMGGTLKVISDKGLGTRVESRIPIG